MGLKLKNENKVKEARYLLPIEYDVACGLIRAEIKSLDALVDGGLPLEDLSQTDEGIGFDEAALQVLEVIETKLRPLIQFIADFRSKIHARPKVTQDQYNAMVSETVAAQIEGKSE